MRPGFRNNTITIKRPLKHEPLREKRGTDTADLANMRPGFFQSNPRIYVPDFDIASEIQQQQQGMKVHLSDETLRTITSANKKVLQLEAMSNPHTLTEAGFKELIKNIKKLDYPDRVELNDVVNKAGSTLAARVLTELNDIVPPPPIVNPTPPQANFLTAKGFEAKQNRLEEKEAAETAEQRRILQQLAQQARAKVKAKKQESDIDEKDESRQPRLSNIAEWKKVMLKQTLKEGMSKEAKKKMKNSPDYVPTSHLKNSAQKYGYSGNSSDRKVLLNFLTTSEEFIKDFNKQQGKGKKKKKIYI